MRRVVTHKGAPALTGRITLPDHVFGHSRLRDDKSEFEQFALNARRLVLDTHPPDQSAQLRLDRWTPSPLPRLPTPITAKACAVPAHNSFGPDDRHRLQDRWKSSIQQHEEHPIAVGEFKPTARIALQHDDLLSKRSILSLKPAGRLERRGQQIEE